MWTWRRQAALVVGVGLVACSSPVTQPAGGGADAATLGDAQTLADAQTVADAGVDLADALTATDVAPDVPDTADVADAPDAQDADDSDDTDDADDTTPQNDDPGPPQGNPVLPPPDATWTVSNGCVLPVPVDAPQCAGVTCGKGLVCMGAGVCVPPDTFEVPAVTDSQVGPALASRPDGAWAVAWYDGTIDTEMHVYLQVSPKGDATLTPPLQVDDPGSHTAYAPAIVSLVDGTWMVVWRDEEFFVGKVRFYGRRVATDGSHVLGPAFEITQGVQYVGGGSTNVVSPVAVRLRNNALLVAWPAQAQPGEPLSVHARRLDQNGAVSGPELDLGIDPGMQAYSPAIAALPLGESLLIWQGSAGKGDVRVYGRRFGNDGAPVGPVVQFSPGVHPYEALPDVAAFDDGAVLVAWKIAEITSSTTAVDIVAQRWPATYTPVGAGQVLGVGADPVGIYPDQPPTIPLHTERAGVLWHTAVVPGSDVFLRRYYREPDAFDCETTSVAGPLDGVEGPERHLPDAEALPDGRILVAWNTYVAGAPRLRMRFLGW